MTATTTTAAAGRHRRARNRRGMGDRLYALLTPGAEVSCFLRTLDADERTVWFRPAYRRIMLNRRGRRPGWLRRTHFRT